VPRGAFEIRVFSSSLRRFSEFSANSFRVFADFLHIFVVFVQLLGVFGLSLAAYRSLIGPLLIWHACIAVFTSLAAAHVPTGSGSRRLIFLISSPAGHPAIASGLTRVATPEPIRIYRAIP
jgi:protein-S-isoprenylcysteine O-methyltransferase Ste14